MKPVTVVIRTIGRPELLAKALASLGRCEPLPDETLVVDQSDGLTSRTVVERCGLPGARVVPSTGRGRSLALNEGLEAAVHDTVLVTDDDCEVRDDWIAVARREMAAVPGGIVTGQVLPGGSDPGRIPSVHVLDVPRDYTGELHCGVLYTGNMACSRDAVLALGGFDERVTPAAEDCDFCYRWLRRGGTLRHVPDLVVWHHDWREPRELETLYVDYYRGQGIFYAKHLRAGDRAVVRFMLNDAISALRAGVGGALLRRRPRWADPRRGIARGLPRGLRDGWRVFGP